MPPTTTIVVPASGLFATLSARLLPAGERFLHQVAAGMGTTRVDE